MMRSTLYIIVLTIGIIGGLIWTQPDGVTERQTSSLKQVLTTTIASADIQLEKTFTGLLQAAQTTQLRFEISGQIQTNYVTPGQSVHQGETLLVLDDSDYLHALQTAKAQLQLEKEALQRDMTLLTIVEQQQDLLAQELTRLETLEAVALASQSERDNTRRQWLQSQTEKTQLTAQISAADVRITIREIAMRQAENNLARTRLTAPFSGIINQVNVVPGDYVGPGEISVELIRVDEVDVTLAVNGDTIRHLHLGMTVTVNIEGKRYQGEISALNIAPDPKTNTYALEVRLSGKGLYPGQLAQVMLPGAYLPAARLVPSSAVRYDNDQASVFEVIDQHIKQRTITVQQSYGEQQIITGLPVGRTIVKQDIYLLNDGQKIVPVESH